MLQNSENDFDCDVGTWEERVFRAAAKFRVHRFYGHGQHDSCEVGSFEDAVRTVGSVRQDKSMPNARATIYAVAASGRFTLLTEARWEQYLGIDALRRVPA